MAHDSFVFLVEASMVRQANARRACSSLAWAGAETEVAGHDGALNLIYVAGRRV
jgi:hypothetical protein